MTIILNKNDAGGLAVFKYWHRCLKCRYAFIEESAKFCGGCGEELKFIVQPAVPLDADGRCAHCGAGDSSHHSFTCPTGLHPDRRK